MPKLLVTGASGFLGWSVCQAASSHWQVFGTYHARSVNIPGCTLIKVDLGDTVSLREMMETLQPDAVIHAAAISQPNVCQAHPDLSFQINVKVSLHLAELCAKAKIPCVFTSTDLVFGGDIAPYRETDAVAPTNLYGEHKVLAEQGMRQRHPQTVICRLPLMYGVVPHASSFIQQSIQILHSQKTLRLFVDERRTPASGDNVAVGLLLALQHQPSCLHLGGPESLSRFEMGQVLVQMLGYGEQYLQPCHRADVAMPAFRPANVSLDSTLAQSLGFRPKSLSTELRRLLKVVPIQS
jgi:dTDP-4-dehydrorhamnose reductase